MFLLQELPTEVSIKDLTESINGIDRIVTYLSNHSGLIFGNLQRSNEVLLASNSLVYRTFISIGDYNKLPVLIQLKNRNHDVDVIFKIELPFLNKTIEFGNSKLSTGEAQIQLVALHDRPTHYFATAKFIIDDLEFPVNYIFPEEVNRLYIIKGNFDQIDAPSFERIGEILDLEESFSNIPESLRSVSLLSLDQMAVYVHPTTKEAIQLSFALSSGDVEFIPSFLAFYDIRYQFRISDPLSTDRRSFMCELSAKTTIADVEVYLRATIGKTYTFSGYLKQFSLVKLVQQFVGQVPETLPSIILKNGYLALSSTGDLTVRASGAIDFWALADSFDIPLPDAIANFEFSSFSCQLNLNDFSYTIDINSNTPIPLLNGSNSGLSITKATLNITSQKDKGINFQTSLSLRGESTLSDEVRLVFNEVNLHYQSENKKWESTGSVQAFIIGNEDPYVLAVELGSERLALSYAGKILITDLGGAGEVSTTSFSIFTEKVDQPNNSKPKYSWGVSGDVKVLQRANSGNEIFSTTGELAIERRPERTTLKVLAQAPVIPAIPLGASEFAPKLKLSITELGLEYASGTNSSTSSWALVAAASLQVVNIPSILGSLIPIELQEGRFRSDREGTSIYFTVPSTLQPAFPDLGFNIGGQQISLTPALAIKSISLEMREHFRIIEELEVGGFSDTINTIYSPQGKKKLLKPIIKAKLALGRSTTLQFSESPFEAFEFFNKVNEEGEIIDDGQWIELDMSPFAKFDLRVPEFSYSKDRWFASGGFDREGDIKIPLTPIKSLFKDNPIAKALPDFLPLLPLNLAADDSYEQLEQLMGILPSEKVKATLRQVLERVREAKDLLPKKLQEYFTIEIPDSAIFEMGMDVKGGMSLGIRTVPRAEEDLHSISDEAKPLQLLLPIIGPMPQLIGLTINALAIGQKNAGAMITIEFDGYIDRFSLPQLALAISQNKIGSNRKEISNRITFKDTLIVMPSALPVPMPIFTNGIQLDYVGAAGTNVQGNWQFPNPEWSVFDYITVFSSLLTFFTDKEALLHQDEALIEAMNLHFAYGPSYIQLPPYLGGGILGLQEPKGPFPLDQAIARFFDFFKTGNLNYLITTLPLENRVGTQHVTFGPIALNAAWCITSEEEFNQLVPEAHQLDESVMQALPVEQDGESFEKGFITLLSGGWEIADITSFQVNFGMALTQDAGFQTGFLMKSGAGAIDLELGGRLQFGPEPGIGTVAGNCALSIDNQDLIRSAGVIRWTPKLFEAEVRLSTPKSGFALESGKLLISKKGMEILGSCQVHELPAAFTLRVKQPISIVYSLRNIDTLQQELNGGLKALVNQVKEELEASLVELEKQEDKKVNLKDAMLKGVKEVIETIKTTRTSSVKSVLEKICSIPGSNCQKCKSEYEKDIEQPFNSVIAKMANIIKEINGNDGSKVSEAIKKALNNKVNVAIKRRRGKKCKQGTITLFSKSYIFHLPADILEKTTRLIDLLANIKDLETVNFKASNAHSKIQEMGLHDLNSEDFTGETPMIKSISFEAALDEQPTEVDMNIIVQHKGKDMQYVIDDFDLLHPVKSIRPLVQQVLA